MPPRADARSRTLMSTSTAKQALRLAWRNDACPTKTVEILRSTRSRSLRPSDGVSGRVALGELVEGDRQGDDHADHDLLDVGRDVRQDEAIDQHAEQGRSDHSA